jgi:hypothetical protein
MNYLKTHLFYLILIAAGIFAGRLWLQEHDLRVQAEAQVKQSELVVKDLQSQIVQTQQQAAAAIKAVQAKVIYVKTPAQAVTAIPDLSTVDLHPRLLPDNPLQIGVDAVPLAQELAQCKEDKIALDACSATDKAKDGIIDQKDLEIKALKKKPSFWNRVKSTMKSVGIGIGIGFALAHHGVL